MKNFKTIMKFTMKDMVFRKTFLITNIMMMFVVIFLSRTVVSINEATEKFMNNQTEAAIEQSAGNVDEEKLEEIKVEAKESVASTIGGTFNSGFVIAFILFFTIYFYGYMVSNSVAQEKTSRVLETLIVSTSPESIVMGKTVAMGLIGIGQMFFLLIVAGISLLGEINLKLNFDSGIFEGIKLAFKNISFGFKELSLNFGNISFGGINFDLSVPTGLAMLLIPLLVLLFFIFGYLFYAFICAIAGAGISKAEDIQIVNGPISIVAMIAFYLAVFTTSMPDSKWAPWAKYLPFSSAFAMPVNILNGTTTAGEILISLLILILSSIWLAFMSIKVYKHVIFNYGNRTKFSDVIKIIFLQK